MKLATSIAAATFGLTLAGCAASTSAPLAGPTFPSATIAATQAHTGTVIGTFIREGGPLGPGGKQPPSIPLSGTLTFSADHRRTIAVSVGKNGRFSVQLQPGVYLVSGRSPRLLEVLSSGSTIEATCTQPKAVRVVAGRTVRVSVACNVP